MPLATCRECGHQVADSATSCPSCGVKGPAADPKKAKEVNIWVACSVILLLASFIWHYMCLPSVGQSSGHFVVKSVNPITNVVVIGAPGGNA